MQPLFLPQVFYSATHRQGAFALARRQTVKKGVAAGWPGGGGAVARIIPIVTARSPLEAAMTKSGALDTGLGISWI